MLFRLIITVTLLVTAWYFFSGTIIVAQQVFSSTFAWMFP